VSVWGVEGRSYMSRRGSSMMVSLNYFCLRGFICGCCLLLLGRVVKGISYANALRGSIWQRVMLLVHTVTARPQSGEELQKRKRG
jgi:hypothetical protein